MGRKATDPAGVASGTAGLMKLLSTMVIEGASFTGTWGISSGPDPYGESSLYSNDPRARYAYEASIAGAYTVSLWWTEHTIWRITSVPVEIFDGDTLLDTVYVTSRPTAVSGMC